MAPTPLEKIDARTDQRTLRDVFGTFPSGVVAVCARIQGVPIGMAASSFTSVSLDPPLVSVCIDNKSSTWPALKSAHRIGISVLGESHDLVCRALSSRTTADRFADLQYEESKDGSIFIPGASSWMECSLFEELPGGDHRIALLKIESIGEQMDTLPLVFHRSGFHSLVVAS